MPSGPRSSIRLRIMRTSLEASTYWKSSRITASRPCPTSPRSARNCASTTSREGPIAATCRSSASVAAPKPRDHLAQGGHHVAKERDPVAVRALHAVPRAPIPGADRELVEQSGLAVARFSRDQDQSCLALLPQPVDEARPVQDRAPRHRRTDLAGDDRQPRGMRPDVAVGARSTIGSFGCHLCRGHWRIFARPSHRVLTLVWISAVRCPRTRRRS